jgi:hypothetical protein
LKCSSKATFFLRLAGGVSDAPIEKVRVPELPTSWKGKSGLGCALDPQK